MKIRLSQTPTDITTFFTSIRNRDIFLRFSSVRRVEKRPPDSKAGLQNPIARHPRQPTERDLIITVCVILSTLFFLCFSREGLSTYLNYLSLLREGRITHIANAPYFGASCKRVSEPDLCNHWNDAGTRAAFSALINKFQFLV